MKMSLGFGGKVFPPKLDPRMRAVGRLVVFAKKADEKFMIHEVLKLTYALAAYIFSSD